MLNTHNLFLFLIGFIIKLIFILIKLKGSIQNGKLQWSDVESSMRLASLGIMGSQLRTLTELWHRGAWLGPLFYPPLCREASVSRSFHIKFTVWCTAGNFKNITEKKIRFLWDWKEYDRADNFPGVLYPNGKSFEMFESF